MEEILKSTYLLYSKKNFYTVVYYKQKIKEP